MSTYEDQIDHLKRGLGVETDAQLANILGYSRANISIWKKRQAIPASALERARALIPVVAQSQAAKQRREQLGEQILYEGRCLALFLAPSLDAVLGRRFPPTAYSGILRQYASLFDEIELACAEEISDRLNEIEGNATDAFEALTIENREALLTRVTERAKWWHFGEASSSRLHEARSEYRGKSEAD